MIIKQRTKPLKLQKMEALISRLPQHFPRIEEIKMDAAKVYKGYIGEKEVDYHIEHLSNQATILQDVHLRSRGKNFQIDTVAITNHAIYCVECKNISGVITFNTILNQFTQQHGTVENGYRYPITQSENHQLQLTSWLHDRNLFNIPVHYFIAISNPGTIIRVVGDEESVARVVAHGEYIPFKIKEIDQKYKQKKSGIWTKEKVGGEILRSSKEKNFNILEKYNIKGKDILTGVKCPGCRTVGMKDLHGSWGCNQCGIRSKYAHRQTLSEYILLLNPWIKNSDAMYFLNISSKGKVTRLLKSSGLIYNPKKRHWIKR